ncbi:HGL341Wp [Eremothecium sinecaudum]|uniref:Histone-lysine N-methyltransferase SET5 n=1 Tax=Eremothecium sinecaudum TaxID=45286 RepID=A0A0X8HV54_9SACH|nr:HGL341Wp [Eremothecium sinecaudum]AMD21999.1 HGL341Wp [Eremothecium sinecaudum]
MQLNSSPSTLKVETISLNDCKDEDKSAAQSVQPSAIEICDEVVLLWRQEPDLEHLKFDKLCDKLKERNPSWVLSNDTLVTVLLEHNLYSADESTLFTYHDEVRSSATPGMRLHELHNVSETTNCKGKALIASDTIPKGELIFEDVPLVMIPPLDKLTLIQLSKACGICGTLLSHNCHYFIMNNLDCDICGILWCSKRCKALDTAHPYLKHPTLKSKVCNAQKWQKFEEFCKENTWYSAYGVGYIYANYVISNRNGLFYEQFLSLAEVSQRTRLKAADSTNVGGTFDSWTDCTCTTIASDLWDEGFRLFCEAFPEAAEDDNINIDTFLRFIGRFNINQLNCQIYPLFSHINHSCEPNVRVEFEKYSIKVYSRKHIKSGDELQISYVNPLHDVSLRRRELRVNWGFLCKCTRCQKELSKFYNKTNIMTSDVNVGLTTQNGKRRKSSMKASKPTLQEILESGHEFDLEIPAHLGFSNRRTSVRFDDRVMSALNE